MAKKQSQERPPDSDPVRLMAWGILNQDWEATQKGFAGMMVPGSAAPTGKKKGRPKKADVETEDTAVSDRHFLLRDEVPHAPTRVTGDNRTAPIGQLRRASFVTDQLRLAPAKQMAAKLAQTRPPKMPRSEAQGPIWVTCGQCNTEFDANKEAQFKLNGREVICPNEQCRNKFAVQAKTSPRNASSSRASSSTDQKSTTTSRQTSKKTRSRTQPTDSSTAPSATSSRKKAKQD